MPTSARDRAEARAAVTRLAERLAAAHRELKRSSAYELFAIQYNAGEINAPVWVREILPHVCRTSITGWTNTLSVEGAGALAGNYGTHRKGTGAMDQPYIAEYCIGHIYKKPHKTATGIYEALKARLTLKNRPEKMPSPRRLQDWYKKWCEANAELFTYISNPDLWRSKFRVAFGDAYGYVDRLNEEWEMDSTPCDLILADGKRHTIVGCIDIYSRRLKFHVSRTSSAHAVATCMRKAVVSWGVPEIVRTDNGQDYVARHIERVLLDMRIEHDVCDPFCPEQKPYIERAFRSFLHDNVELLCGYVGHNVSERKALEARKSFAQRMMDHSEPQTVELRLTPEELQNICDRWTDDTYMHRRHSKLGCTPYEQVRAYDGPVSRVKSKEALRLLYLPCVSGDGTRVVSKDGGVKALTDEYIAPALALHVGRRVQVRHDDEDYGRVDIYSLDGSEYICTARGIKYSGMTAKEVREIANAAVVLQRHNLSGRRAALAAAAKAANLDQIEYERMKADELRARRIEAERPLRAELMDIHATPALEGAEAAAAKPDPTPAPVTEDELAARREAMAAFEKAKAADKARPEDPDAQLWAWACRMEEAEARGEVLSTEDRRKLENYRRTPKYDARKRLRECTGPDGLLKAACG
jgi:hypothetical protein